MNESARNGWIHLKMPVTAVGGQVLFRSASRSGLLDIVLLALAAQLGQRLAGSQDNPVVQVLAIVSHLLVRLVRAVSPRVRVEVVLRL